jgi:hypothetical protein
MTHISAKTNAPFLFKTSQAYPINEDQQSRAGLGQNFQLDTNTLEFTQTARMEQPAWQFHFNVLATSNTCHLICGQFKWSAATAPKRTMTIQ